jgi:hypothetical protein
MSEKKLQQKSIVAPCEIKVLYIRKIRLCSYKFCVKLYMVTEFNFKIKNLNPHNIF